MKKLTLSLIAVFTFAPFPLILTAAPEQDRPKVPNKLVVLTFDDGNVSDLTTVAPLLKEYGFGATFFITSGWLEKTGRLTWAQVLELEKGGFEIGCHTASHPNLLRLSAEEIHRQIAEFDRACAQRGIRKATSFSYPGGHFDRRPLTVLKKLGYNLARRGRDPERPLEDNGGNGRAYVPHDDHPLLIPSTLTRGISALEDERIVQALDEATSGRIAVLTYHGVPDLNRHCSTPIDRFRKDMAYLKKSGATVIALRDLSRYVDLSNHPADPFESIVRRLGLRTGNPHCDASGSVPRFSWKPESTGWTQKQVAYRILVASSREHLEQGNGDIWDSGKVSSASPIRASYTGPRLKPGHNYWWNVQLWNQRDPAEITRNAPYQSEEMVTELYKSRPGPFSEPARFRIAP